MADDTISDCTQGEHIAAVTPEDVPETVKAALSGAVDLLRMRGYGEAADLLAKEYIPSVMAELWAELDHITKRDVRGMFDLD